jgi:hypothetical protein
MRQILQAGQVQAGRVDPEEQVTDGAVAREGAHLIPPLGDLLPLAFLKGHHLHRVERGAVADHRLLRADDIAVLETDAGEPISLDDDLVHVRVQLQFPAELFEAALESLPEL